MSDRRINRGVTRTAGRYVPSRWLNPRRTAHNRSMCQCHATPRTPGIGDHSGLVVHWPDAIVTCQTFEERRQDEICYQLVRTSAGLAHRVRECPEANP